MKANLIRRTQRSNRLMPSVLEALEGRTLCYAIVPAGYTALETIQIRPAAATYPSDLTLTAKTPYFFLATGVTETSANVFHGDAAFPSGSNSLSAETTAWGVTATVGSQTTTTADWGAFTGDAKYGQTFTPTSTGNLSFAFANDGLDKISSIAVTVYAAVPAIKVATIRTDVATGSVAVSALPGGKVYLPLNNADWDHNGTADDQQSGRVVGDKFLLPVTLPAIAGASASARAQIHAPKGLRVWLNADRTGSTVGLGLSVTAARTVYVEATAEQLNHAPLNLKVFLPIDGVSVEQRIPISVFSLGGSTTATGGIKQTFSSDSPTGKWLTAVGGTLDTSSTSIVKGTAYTNVVWSSTTETGYADFDVDADYIWGWPVAVTA